VPNRGEEYDAKLGNRREVIRRSVFPLNRKQENRVALYFQRPIISFNRLGLSDSIKVFPRSENSTFAVENYVAKVELERLLDVWFCSGHL
jgi:hypothetical protein